MLRKTSSVSSSPLSWLAFRAKSAALQISSALHNLRPEPDPSFSPLLLLLLSLQRPFSLFWSSVTDLQCYEEQSPLFVKRASAQLIELKEIHDTKNLLLRTHPVFCGKGKNSKNTYPFFKTRGTMRKRVEAPSRCPSTGRSPSL